MAMGYEVNIKISSTHKDLGDSAKKKKKKKKTPGKCFSGKRNIKVFKTNLFESGSAKIITTGFEASGIVKWGLWATFLLKSNKP